MVRVRKHTRLPLVTYLRGGPPSIWKLTFPKEVRPGRDSAEEVEGLGRGGRGSELEELKGEVTST